MTDPTSDIARTYVSELEAALATAPAAVRTEIVADVAGELHGLTDAEARERIAALGDPQKIAADAAAQSASDAPAAPGTAPATPSKTYPTITAIVLTVGWYVAALGWIAGLVMIGVGDRWLPAEKRRAILTSIAGTVVAILALLFFRTTDVGLIGLALFLVIPLITNVFVGSYLRRTWR